MAACLNGASGLPAALTARAEGDIEPGTATTHSRRAAVKAVWEKFFAKKSRATKTFHVRIAWHELFLRLKLVARFVYSCYTKSYAFTSVMEKCRPHSV